MKEDDGYAVDDIWDEDHLGDMDFKVAGSSDGVTALQMDIKIQGTLKRSCVSLAQAQTLVCTFWVK